MKSEFLKTQVFSIAGEMLHEKLFHGQVTLTQTPSVNSPQILLALNLTSDSANPPPPPSKEMSVSQQDTEIIHHHALSGSSDSTENSSAFDDQEVVEKVNFSFNQQVLDEIANLPDSPVDAAEASKAEDITATDKEQMPESPVIKTSAIKCHLTCNKQEFVNKQGLGQRLRKCSRDEVSQTKPAEEASIQE